MNSLGYGLVIIHFRDQASVSRLLRSTQSWTNPPERIVVVDNSGDLSLGHFDDHPQFEEVVLGDNPGYGAAANAGLLRLEAAGLERALVCTQDASLDTDAARIMVAVMATGARVAAVAPVLEFSSDSTILFSAGGRLDQRGRATHPGQGRRRLAASPQAPYDVDWADGAILLLSINAVREVGFFDEAYFLYVEEVDLLFRLRKRGSRVVVAPQAVGRQEPGNYVPYLRFRNHVYFTRKFADELRPWPWLRVLLQDWIGSFFGRSRFDFKGSIAGIRDGAAGRMGPPRGWVGRKN